MPGEAAMEAESLEKIKYIPYFLGHHRCYNDRELVPSKELRLLRAKWVVDHFAPPGSVRPGNVTCRCEMCGSHLNFWARCEYCGRRWFDERRMEGSNDQAKA